MMKTQPEWIWTVCCPFCNEPILNEYDMSDVPDEIEEEELYEINDKYQVGASGYCEHLAYSSVWGYIEPEINSSWIKELVALAKSLEGRETDPPVEQMSDKQIAEHICEVITEGNIDDDALRTIANSVLPGHQVELIDISFDSHAEGPPGGTDINYLYIFMTAK